jgi:hypothetical protein
MTKATPFDQPAVQAIFVTTDAQRRAFRVVDAVDDLESSLGAYRAVQQLANNERLDGDEYLPQLKRGDLAMLLRVLNTNLETRCAHVREAAVTSSMGCRSCVPAAHTRGQFDAEDGTLVRPPVRSRRTDARPAGA